MATQKVRPTHPNIKSNIEVGKIATYGEETRGKKEPSRQFSFKVFVKPVENVENLTLTCETEDNSVLASQKFTSENLKGDVDCGMVMAISSEHDTLNAKMILSDQAGKIIETLAVTFILKYDHVEIHESNEDNSSQGHSSLNTKLVEKKEESMPVIDEKFVEEKEESRGVVTKEFAEHFEVQLRAIKEKFFKQIKEELRVLRENPDHVEIQSNEDNLYQGHSSLNKKFVEKNEELRVLIEKLVEQKEESRVLGEKLVAQKEELRVQGERFVEQKEKFVEQKQELRVLGEKFVEKNKELRVLGEKVSQLEEKVARCYCYKKFPRAGEELVTDGQDNEATVNADQ